MKILIADDHIVLRVGLRQMLIEAFPDVVFGETGSTSETLDAIRHEKWDILLLDISLPGRSGLDVLDEARREFSELPVLVFSSMPEEQIAIRVLKAGAAGYLNKQSIPEELIGAVKKVLASGRYVSPSLAEQLVRELNGSDKPPHESLSNREFEVFQLMTMGQSIKEIAADLSLSPKTISTFRCRIFEKLRVHNDIELANYAYRHQLFGLNV